MIETLSDMLKRSPHSPGHQTIRLALAALVVGGAIWSHASISGEGNMDGPYSVIGYNYTDRNIASFVVNDFGAGPSEAHQAGGGGGIACCFDIPKHAKTLHIKVELGLTKEQYDKDLPNEKFETDVPVPPLPNKHDGFIEFHFLPHQRVEAAWVSFPAVPHIPETH